MRQVYYHANCFDGLTAAYMIDADEYIPCVYGETPCPTEGDDVIVVDFSWDRESMVGLHRCCNSLRVFDHHKTAEEELRGLDFCTFDVRECGASLVAAWLVERGPWFLPYVRDRDLWLWELPETKAVMAYMGTLELDHPYTLRSLESMSEEDVIFAGRALVRWQDKLVKVVLEDVGVRWGVPCLYWPGAYLLVSELGDAMCRMYQSGWCIIEYPDGRRSLRSRGDVDVSAIAKAFGGGGHRGAAGTPANAEAETIKMIEWWHKEKNDG